jgi:flavin-dependent dehydrogenase
VECRFILDASGFGRVLPRLLDLEAPSDFPVRQAVFTHVDDHIPDGEFDRNKILVTVHPQEKDIWYWLIPFSDGRCSLGVVAAREKIALRRESDLIAQLRRFIAEAPELNHLLRNACFNYTSREIVGYAAKVKTLAGDKFALLGNAGEFLDPVFSSGVTIAMRSASTAVKVLDRQLRGGAVDWQEEYAKTLRRGIDTFRVFVEAWYDGRFQDIIFYPEQTPSVRRMISSVLAGYAWDTSNPFVDGAARRMNALADYCRQQT